MKLVGELGRVYEDGEIICCEGNEGKDMYVIQSGNVKVTKGSPNGELFLATLKEGEIFGEMALFDRLPRSATVRASGVARILCIDRKGFFTRISKDPTMALKLLETMSKRIRALNEELTRFKKSRRKIMNRFVDISETSGLILEEIKRSIKADNGSVMLLDEKKKTLKIIAAFGVEANQKTELALGTGIAGDVLKTGRIELINNISADSRFVPGQMKFKTLLCAPLKVRDRILGVINLSNSYGSFFDLEDLKLLRVLSVHASIAIENARLFSMTEKITESIIKHATLLDMS